MCRRPAPDPPDQVRGAYRTISAGRGWDPCNLVSIWSSSIGRKSQVLYGSHNQDLKHWFISFINIYNLYLIEALRPWGLEALRPWLMPRVIESNGLQRCPTSSNWICCLKTRDSWAQLDELDTWKTLRQIDWTRGKIAFFLRQTSSQIRRKWTIAMQVWGVAESWTPILAVILSWTQHQHISMFKAGFCTSRSKTAQTFQDEKAFKEMQFRMQFNARDQHLST